MSVDLTLLPVLTKDFWVCHDQLRLNSRRALWPEIDKLPQIPIGKITCFFARNKETGETEYGELTEDPYGGYLKWTTVEALLTLKDHQRIQDNWQNRAIWAWLSEMPKDWQIVLYWS